MKISEWLSTHTKQLTNAGISTPRLDCLILLEDTYSKSRSWLLAHQDEQISTTQLHTLNALIKRRLEHEPLAYIRGKSEFYGREFAVNAHTLQPRPETETMVSLVLKNKDTLGKHNLIDIGAGSGAIGITLKLELPDAVVLATDISKECINATKENARNLGASITICNGDLLTPVIEMVTTPYHIVCNLPYVPSAYTINQAAMFEPELAIFGGEDGLDYYRQLFEQLDSLKDKPLSVYTESLPTQHALLVNIANKYGYKPSQTEDFIIRFVPAKTETY